MAGIRSTTGNITHNAPDNMASNLSNSKQFVESVIGKIGMQFTQLWSGGFRGMSEQGIAELKTQITKYCESVQDVINSFDQTGDITSALKGEVQTAAYDFIAAIKELLQAYVSTMRQEIQEVQEAYDNFVKAGSSIASDVRSNADDVRSDAARISLD